MNFNIQKIQNGYVVSSHGPYPEISSQPVNSYHVKTLDELPEAIRAVQGYAAELEEQQRRRYAQEDQVKGVLAGTALGRSY